MIFGSAAYVFIARSPAEDYPVPPVSLTIDDLQRVYKGPVGSKMSGSIKIHSSPEGFPLENGEGVQFMITYEESRVLVIVFFMRFDSEADAKRTANKILAYIGNFSEKYESWSYANKSKLMYAKFEYSDMISEMWSSKNWVIEVVIGKAGRVGEEILKDVKASINELPG